MTLCGVELNEDGNVKFLNQKLNYSPQKQDLGIGPDNLKQAKSLSAFKNGLKKFNIDKCPCKLCRDYIHGVSYSN